MPAVDTSGAAGLQSWAKAAFLCAVVLACANVLVFASRHANPLPIADDWIYLDGFIRKAATSGVSLSDFFLKRFALDHVQPLRRAILLAQYRWFGLDYGVQAIVGVLFAFANLALLWRLAMAASRQPRDGWRLHLAFLGIVAVYLSLNAGTIYTWPLLTLAFSSHFFVFACLFPAWKANAGGDPRAAWMLFAAAFAMDVVADDTGLLVSIAIACAAFAWRIRNQGTIAEACRRVVLPVAAAYAAYRVLRFLLTRGASIADPLPNRFIVGNIWPSIQERWPELVSGLHVPLVASVLQKGRLATLFGSGAAVAEWTIAAAMLAAHGWFWWHAFAKKTGRAGFAAMVLMLYAYGAVAGILIGRASVFGEQYFWQPRYVFLYQLGVVALLLMAIDALSAGATTRRFSALRVGVPLLAALLVGLQFWLSATTWSGSRYGSNYQKRLASQIGELANHPERVPEHCLPALLVCEYPADRRRELVAFLKDNKLNVFSPSFQDRYRLRPAE